MGSWLLLGTDSLIACVAVGPIMTRKLSVLVPFALLFGVTDGAAYLLGTAIHWSYPDNLGFVAPTVLVVLGLYWLFVAVISKRAAAAEGNPRSQWGVWVLPFILTLDNITYGAVDGVSSGASVALSAFEQALSSAIQAGAGLAIGMAIAYSIPGLRRNLWLANAVAGVLMIAGAGVVRAMG